MNVPPPPPRLCSAWIRAWPDRGPGALVKDLVAGLIVALVALPLSMALAIASGAPPIAGLATAIVAGTVVPLLGGARYSVCGPTAALVAVVLPVIGAHGLSGLALATFLAGGILIGLGLLRLGSLIQFVPYPVTLGFTAGIAVVIAGLQIENLAGLRLTSLEPGAHFPEHLRAVLGALPVARPGDLLIGGVTLLALLGWQRRKSRVPSHLIGLLVGALVGLALGHWAPELRFETVASRYGTAEFPSGLPQTIGALRWPWPEGGPSLKLVRELLPSALSIALLAAIVTLLCAVVADASSGERHDPDAELIALGVGNLLSPCFGGLPATGALARTLTNLRSGARTPLAAAASGMWVALGLFVLADWMQHLPMAALGALLLVVAWNMAEVQHLKRILREAPKHDAWVLFCCLFLTVAFDMTIAVSAGVLLASMLFMRRMVALFEVRLVEPGRPGHGLTVPSGVSLYQIAGPLFFGAAHKGMGALVQQGSGAKVIVIDLERVPIIDASGLFNLRSTLERLNKRGVSVLLAGLSAELDRTLRRAHLIGLAGSPATFPDTRTALDAAAAILGEAAPSNPPALPLSASETPPGPTARP